MKTTLLIDAGNTRIKFGWLQPLTNQRETQALALPHAALEAQLPQWLATLPSKPEHSVGVNVAGKAMAARIQALLKSSACHIDWISSTPAAAGVINNYRTPSQLGPDRWLALIGLAEHTRHLPESPLLLASFGTATTIDSLSPASVTTENSTATDTRCFQGGLILPGVHLMRSSLAKGTANLPMSQGDIALYPEHTEQAISSGIAAAQAGALLRQWLLLKQTHAVAPLVFASGGAWFDIQQEAIRLLIQAGTNANAIQWLPSLVLDGLAQLSQTSNLAE